MSPKNNKTEASLAGSLDKLKEILNESKNELPNEVFDDEFLSPFLKTRKFDVKRTASLVKNFIGVEEKISNISIPSNYLEILKECGITIGLFKNRDKLGRIIFFARAINWDPNLITHEQLIHISYLFVLKASRDKSVQEKGLVIIIDVEGASLSHIRHVGFSGVKMTNTIFHDSVPVRIKEIHIVNNNYFGNIAFSLSKRCLKAKIINRHILHGRTYDKLLDYFDHSILPEIYGGNLTIDEAIDQDHTFKTVPKI